MQIGGWSVIGIVAAAAASIMHPRSIKDQFLEGARQFAIRIRAIKMGVRAKQLEEISFALLGHFLLILVTVLGRIDLDVTKYLVLLADLVLVLLELQLPLADVVACFVPLRAVEAALVVDLRVVPGEPVHLAVVPG
ncbi:hypothetical protein BRADI_4g14015v3 [Brachypodium distachyon]|uniref:Uncharacterized protein n=1 Tax=Brachypodium distachyon TaxID=15368 RepID=A0A0Q3H379_BRADI|nr:hypothetical protein BRADI_4g14015v3 [Brachypodium distachyon]